MKKCLILFKTCLIMTVLLISSCKDYLNLEPRNMISGEKLFADPNGVKAYMANIYHNLPIEDFAYSVTQFNHNDGAPYQSSMIPTMMSDETVYTSPWWFSEWSYTWTDYGLIRSILDLQQMIPNIETDDQNKKYIKGEVAFCLAYCYFAMTKRCGGMPILRKPIEYDRDRNKLLRPRDKEVDCWDYVMAQCDTAIMYLPDAFAGQSARANKWVAYALKSRAALYAASYAENWLKVPFTGEAVNAKVVGMSASEAPRFYSMCIDASNAIMQSGRFGLYKPNPANPAEAAKNYQHLFETPADAPSECIWMKWYDEPGGTYKGHNYDIWYNPNQTRNGWSWGGFQSPVLDLVDAYEDYTDDGTGASKPIRTKNVANPLSGDINKYGAFADGWCGFDLGADYYRFDSPTDIFKDKDARLQASVILPGSTWKNKKIIIQGGFIYPSNWPALKIYASTQGLDGKTYYTYGSDDYNQYSGYDEPHQGSQGGFLFKKFLQESIDVPPQFNRGTNDWIEFRYAEVLLNYAEAAVASGSGDQQKAKEALNDIRHRAAHKDDIPATLANIWKERYVELAFENKRIWDLIRLRQFDRFQGYRRKDLIPVLDLRVNPPKYIFLRADVDDVDRGFRKAWYYRTLWMPYENGLLPQPY